MKKVKSNTLIAIAYGCLVISLVSLFTTIIGYTNKAGIHKTFSIIDFVSSNEYDKFVSAEYAGTVYWNIDWSVIRIFAAVGVGSLICAAVGLALISRQKKNIWPFTLTLLGLIGTMAPSVLIFTAVIVLRNEFLGQLNCGIYPILTPIAMIVCIFAATQMHRRNREYIRRLKDAEGLIFPGGDL